MRFRILDIQGFPRQQIQEFEKDEAILVRNRVTKSLVRMLTSRPQLLAFIYEPRGGSKFRSEYHDPFEIKICDGDILILGYYHNNFIYEPTITVSGGPSGEFKLLLQRSSGIITLSPLKGQVGTYTLSLQGKDKLNNTAYSNKLNIIIKG
jgi:hypothetical protein